MQKTHTHSLVITMYITRSGKVETSYSLITFLNNKRSVVRITRIKLKYYFKKAKVEKNEIHIKKFNPESLHKTSFINISIYGHN